MHTQTRLPERKAEIQIQEHQPVICQKMSKLIFKLWDSFSKQIVGMVDDTLTTFETLFAAEETNISSKLINCF